MFVDHSFKAVLSRIFQFKIEFSAFIVSQMVDIEARFTGLWRGERLEQFENML